METEVFEAFGLYTGEPGTIEILQRKVYHELNGQNSLAIRVWCPACNKWTGEWIRNEWCICYPCELAFTNLERYDDLTIDYDMEETVSRNERGE